MSNLTFITDARKKTCIFFIKKAECLGQEISLPIKVTIKSYETDYEIPCTSGICGRRKRQNLRM